MTTPTPKRWIASLKSRIRQSQTKAALHINSALIELYWSIGADIVERQAEAVWGSGIFNQISRDIRAEFPDIKGFFYEKYNRVRPLLYKTDAYDVYFDRTGD